MSMRDALLSLRTSAVPTISTAAIIVILLLLPLTLNGYGQQVVMIGFYYVVLGISWNLLAGYTGQFSLAQHAFAALGAYASAAAVLALGMPVVVGIAAGAVVAAVLGFGLGWLTLGMRGIYFAIGTWAFAESVRILLAINYQITRGDMGLPVPFLFETPDPLPYYYVFLVASLLTVGLNAVLLRTKVGYRMRAIRDDQELAVASGVDVVKWKRLVFMLSTGLAGLSGALYGHSLGLLSPNQAHFSQMAFVIIAVVLGGFRTLWGPVVGALLAQGLAEALRVQAEWRFVIFALLVILVVRLYPPGIMGGLSALYERFRRTARKIPTERARREVPGLPS
jgi:branched-chain amino acid transport system permease protein